jgi:hypothetical protein
MKNLNFNHIIAVFVVALIVFTQCKKCPEITDPCQIVKCADGFNCDEGVCKCPEGKFLFNNQCVSLAPNSYYAIAPACYCYDTLAMGVVTNASGQSALSVAIKSGNLVGSATVTGEFFDLPDGDSIHIYEMPTRCDLPNNVSLKPEAFGKFTQSGNLILELRFKNTATQEVVDKCVMTMRKF